MNLYHLLKNLQHIKPDSAYTHKSRMLLVGDIQPHGTRGWLIFWTKSIRYGSSFFVLIGALVLFFLGGLSLVNLFSPLSKLSSLDAAALRAEAQAIDVQINLTNLTYAEPETAGGGALSVPPPAAIRRINQTKALNSPPSSPVDPNIGTSQITEDTVVASDTIDISVDEILEQLSE